METTIPLKEIDFLLQRNWFFDRESVVKLLYLADDYSWEWIIANIKRYPNNIRDIISVEACIDSRILESIAKTKIRDLDDDEYEKMLIEQKDIMNKRNEKTWIAYKELYDISRPELAIDVECENIYNKIQEQYKLTKNKRVVPPDVQNNINTLQNEFDKLKTRIEQEDKDWEYLTKTDLILNGTLSKMQKEVCGYPNV